VDGVSSACADAGSVGDSSLIDGDGGTISPVSVNSDGGGGLRGDGEVDGCVSNFLCSMGLEGRVD
jgi:hypothetical protein